MQNAQRIEVDEATCGECGHWRPAHRQEWGSQESCSLCGCRAWADPVDVTGWGNPWDGMSAKEIADLGDISNKKKVSAWLAKALKAKKVAVVEDAGWE